MLHVTIYTVDHGDAETQPSLAEGLAETVDYVSYFNGGTHGPPALVAPGRQDGRTVMPIARPGDTVLYVNTSLVPALKIQRADES